MNEYFPLCLHVASAANSRVEVLRMDWADREDVVELLTEQIVDHDA
jgi:hypothetical protein